MDRAAAMLAGARVRQWKYPMSLFGHGHESMTITCRVLALDPHGPTGQLSGPSHGCWSGLPSHGCWSGLPS